VALVGYTNAGKSTLLNKLAGAEVLVADKLFATLDPTTRRIDLTSGREVLLTDTVGFIQKLPTMLVASFRATLEEIAESDLLLHVLDITHPNASEHAQSVLTTLKEIAVRDIPMVTALNKIDVLENREHILGLVDEFERAIPISAVTGENLPSLLTAIEEVLYKNLLSVRVLLPYKAGGLINLFHDLGTVEVAEHTEGGVILTGNIPRHLFGQFATYLLENEKEPNKQC
jgi:GTP-binding protein HflX